MFGPSVPGEQASVVCKLGEFPGMFGPTVSAGTGGPANGRVRGVARLVVDDPATSCSRAVSLVVSLRGRWTVLVNHLVQRVASVTDRRRRTSDDIVVPATELQMN